MSVTINGSIVPIIVDAGVDANVISRLSTYKPFDDWVKNLDSNFICSKITIQSVDYFGPRIGFLKFKADITFNGKPIPGIVFMRGGAVAILVILECDHQFYVLLTCQPRAPMGSSNFLEIPAGMLDGSNNFAGVAAKELDEETGIKINTTNLIHLGEMIPSAGGCDEFIRLYLHKLIITPDELTSLQGKCTGSLEEGEQITLKIVPYENVLDICTDAKAMCAMLKYELYNRS
jgi:ADP-sugar diphosphatase